MKVFVVETATAAVATVPRAAFVRSCGQWGRQSFQNVAFRRARSALFKEALLALTVLLHTATVAVVLVNAPHRQGAHSLFAPWLGQQQKTWLTRIRVDRVGADHTAFPVHADQSKLCAVGQHLP